MVGVPGKYKGCHTCRGRRVKCDMGRPACKKCTDSNRLCEGYEKQMTFIVSGPNQLGRCSSHPHRSILKSNAKKNDPPPTRRRTSAPASVSQPPMKEILAANINIGVFAHTNSLALHQHYDNEVDDCFTLPTLAYTLPILDDPYAVHEFCLRAFTFTEDMRRHSGDDDVNTRTRKRHTRNLPTSAPGQKQEEAKMLYVFSSINESSDDYNFEHIGGTLNQVKFKGPAAFQQRPAHHFFARMWRPLAISCALRQQQSTFLEHDVWCTGPFEGTEKSSFDRLWDITARVSGICERAHRTLDISIKTNTHHFMRAKKAEDLLKNGCVQIQADFDVWLQELQGNADGLMEHSSVYRPVVLQQSTKRRRSPSMSSAFPPHQFRDAETAQLLVTYWSALITFHKLVSELLVVAEPSAQQEDRSHSQLTCPSSAATTPAYSSSSPQASVTGASATSPPISINTPEYSTYSLPDLTPSYPYDTSATGTRISPQYTSEIFLPQHQMPYINFQPETYPTTTGYEIPSTYGPHSGYPALFEPSMNISIFPDQVDNSFHFDELSYVHADPTPSYLNPNQMDYLPPPQRNHTPSSYISIASAPGSHQSNVSAPASYHSQRSPDNSFVSSAAASHVGCHAATPPDHNAIASHDSSSHPTSSSAGNAYTGQFPSLHQNSRPEKLTQFAKLIGAGLDFLFSSRHDNGLEVVLLMWPLEVLEGMCISNDEKMRCGGLRNEMERQTEEIGRWVRERRWRAVAVCGDEGAKSKAFS